MLNPLLILIIAIGAVTVAFLVAFLSIKDKKTAFGFERTMKDSEITKRLLRYAKPHVKGILVVCLLMVVAVLYEIANPILLGVIEEILAEEFEMKTIFLLIGLYIAILLISVVCSYFQTMLLQKIGQKIVSKMREDVFSHIEDLSHNQLHHIPVGTLVTRVTNDTEAVNRFIMLFINMSKNIAIVIGILIAMFCVNWTLALVVSCFVPFIALFTVIFRKFSRRANRRVKDGTTAINIFLSENLTGMKIIQMFRKEKSKLNEFDKHNNELSKAKNAQIFVFSIFRPMIYLLYISSIMALFYFGAKGYIQPMSWIGPVVTGGTIVTFYSFNSRFFNPIQNIAEQFHRMQAAYASAEKIFTLMDNHSDLVDAPDAYDIPEVKGDIVFDHVWFAYKEEEWVLKDVSFHVKAGESVAFVGATGAGKTTILSLLCRNYDIQKGTIYVDGHDISKVTKASLRKNFGQMLQDVFLFAGTVRSNIVLGREDFTDEEINKVCAYVNADKFIEKLPKGLDEEVIEQGANFSAGQRQLLSFARTVIHTPKVMILDEATANIDTETEELIQDSLTKMKNIGTMLVVAHRLSTIRESDCIYVLDHGKIIEQGTHEELLKQNGRYHTLYMMQYHREQLTNNQ